MIEFVVLWWQWVVLGLVMLILDVVILGSTGIILWFGAGAIAVGMWMFFGPATPSWVQFVLWMVFSIVPLVSWMFFYRPRADRRRIAEAAQEVIGAIGVVVQAAVQDDGVCRGTIRLQRPFARRDIWKFQSDEALAQGNRAAVMHVGDDGLLAVHRESEA